MPNSPRTDSSFRRLFDSHHRDIHAFCLRRLPVDDANEATSEVFLTAWRRFDAVPDVMSPEALMWLYGVARNVVRNQQRTARRQVRLKARTNAVAPVAEDGPEIQVIRAEEHEEVTRAMGKLKALDREVLQLKVWEGLSNSDVGEILGLTDRAVEGRYTRCLKKLTKELEKGSGGAQGSPFSNERGGARA